MDLDYEIEKKLTIMGKINTYAKNKLFNNDKKVFHGPGSFFYNSIPLHYCS